MASLLHLGLALWPTLEPGNPHQKLCFQSVREKGIYQDRSRRLNKAINSKIMVLNRYSIKNYISELGYIC